MPEATRRDPDAIDLDLVPSPRSGLVTWLIDGDSVIVDPKTRQATVMNGFASVIWGCLDGQASLRDLIPDVAYAFNAPPDEVAQHILAFGRGVGRAGLLRNVRTSDGPGRLGLTCGETVAGFEAQARDCSGGKALIANWSPSCEYCVVLAPELAALSPALQQAGVDLVLLASGGRDENVALLERCGLAARLALRPPSDTTGTGYDDPFSGMGTPVAYLVDEKGTVLADLAVGMVEVARLARVAAGHLEPIATPIVARGDDNLSTRYLSATPSAGMCGPCSRGDRRHLRTWEPTATYEVDGFCIGVRADSEATDRLVGHLLAAHRVTAQGKPPVHLSVVMPRGDRAGARSLNLLLVGNETVIRSRSPRRVLHGLGTYLSVLVAEESGALAPTGTWAVSALPAIVGDAAVLLPAALRGALAAAQPRLARAGFRLVDMPMALIDPATGDLVVPPPRVEIDETVLERVPDLDPGSSEGAWVPPGRYPLLAWALGPTPDGNGSFTAAGIVAAAWSSCISPPGSPEVTLTALANLFERVHALPVLNAVAGEIVDDLSRRVASLG